MIDRQIHRAVAATFTIVFALRRYQARVGRWLARVQGRMTEQEQEARRSEDELARGRSLRRSREERRS